MIKMNLQINTNNKSNRRKMVPIVIDFSSILMLALFHLLGRGNLHLHHSSWYTEFVDLM